MSTEDKKGLVSAKIGMAKINNGIADGMGLERSQRIDRICVSGVERRGHSRCQAGTEVGRDVACWESLGAQVAWLPQLLDEVLDGSKLCFLSHRGGLGPGEPSLFLLLEQRICAVFSSSQLIPNLCTL